jgi:hypothetical protein
LKLGKFKLDERNWGFQYPFSLALGGWRMVFSFPEKTSSFVRFFGGQKTGTKWSTKVN